MDINLKTLDQLVTVARIGNISRAAEELHISQPALSRSIAAFERQFGVRLFERGRRGATLTPVGVLAIKEAEALIRQASAIGHNLRLYGEGVAGKIHLGMGPLIASIALAGLGQHFLRTRPQLQIQTTIKGAPSLVQDLVADHIELMFAAGPQLDVSDDIAVQGVGTLELANIVRAGHPLASRKSVTQADMSDYPILCGAELSTVAPREGRFLCDNYHILRDTCLQTDGIWICSPKFVEQEIESGQFRVLPQVDSRRPAQIKLSVLRRKALSPTPVSSAMVEFMREYFAGKQ